MDGAFRNGARLREYNLLHLNRAWIEEKISRDKYAPWRLEWSPWFQINVSTGRGWFYKNGTSQAQAHKGMFKPTCRRCLSNLISNPQANLSYFLYTKTEYFIHARYHRYCISFLPVNYSLKRFTELYQREEQQPSGNQRHCRRFWGHHCLGR